MIRKHAVALYEGYGMQIYEDGLNTLRRDENLQVRQQLAYSLQRAIVKKSSQRKHLAALLCDNAENPYLLAAGLSSITKENWPGIIEELKTRSKLPQPLLAPISRLATAYGDKVDATNILLYQLNTLHEFSLEEQIQLAAKIIDALNSDFTLKETMEKAGIKDTETKLQQLKQIQAEAMKLVANPQVPVSKKLKALPLLGADLGNDRDDHKLLVSLLNPRQPDELQAAAVQQLSRRFDVLRARLAADALEKLQPEAARTGARHPPEPTDLDAHDARSTGEKAASRP